MTPGPCAWPYTACECAPLDNLTPEAGAEVIAWASQLLWTATGKIFGPCPVSVLPCNDGVALCGSCGSGLRRCGCRSVPEIRLPGPVHSVTEVVIDGVAVADTGYRVDDWVWLVRTDGGVWPSNVDPLDPDGFRVDYLLGDDPPGGAGLVSGILACELAKAICGDETCRLPRRVRRMTRQGLAVEWEPGAGFGLPEIDQWVTGANQPIFAGAVHSPDFPHIRQVTWTADASPGSP